MSGVLQHVLFTGVLQYVVGVSQELGPVTLQNMALMNMEENPTQGFEKLQFLLQQVACPPGE